MLVGISKGGYRYTTLHFFILPHWKKIATSFKGFYFFIFCYNYLMDFKKILDQLNIFAQCRRYGLSLWQCPQFLFLVMGIVIILVMLASYQIAARRIEDPIKVTSIVTGICIILLIIDFLIVRSFERLAEANRMKSEFVSVVSHQLRSPLSNLKWAIELLMSGRLGRVEEKQTEYFRILKENISRMGELVSDLLIVSRIETATLPQKKKEFSLEDLTKKLILELQPFARASNVEIKFEAQEDLPQVFADPSQIRLVVENLLDNAIRYISPVRDVISNGVREKGEVKIKIERKGKKILFEIKDAGVGIPKEDQKYIFQKFFRSENVLRYQTQGSGLGLFITKSIVERSGGKIWFKSKEGVGTTFWFTLPITH